MLFSSKYKWHEGPKWERFFQIYDAIAKDMFEESRQVATHYGATQVHMSGNPQNPPIVFFHGIATCRLMYGACAVLLISSSRSSGFHVSVPWCCTVVFVVVLHGL